MRAGEVVCDHFGEKRGERLAESRHAGRPVKTALNRVLKYSTLAHLGEKVRRKEGDKGRVRLSDRGTPSEAHAATSHSRTGASSRGRRMHRARPSATGSGKSQATLSGCDNQRRRSCMFFRGGNVIPLALIEVEEKGNSAERVILAAVLQELRKR